jgi:hypothetical protein
MSELKDGLIESYEGNFKFMSFYKNGELIEEVVYHNGLKYSKHKFDKNYYERTFYYLDGEIESIACFTYMGKNILPNPIGFTHFINSGNKSFLI